MPTTWWAYGLYGLMELTRPHWFGWWSVLLLVCICIVVRLLTHKQKLQDSALQIVPSRNRSVEFNSATTLEWITKLMLERSWTYSPDVPLWVTLLSLQSIWRRKDHTQFLLHLEKTLYDGFYDTKITTEEARVYLLNHRFFDWLTTPWIVR